MYGWLAKHISFTDSFIDLFDRVLVFIISCIFSAHHYLRRLFGGQNLTRIRRAAIFPTVKKSAAYPANGGG